LEQSSYTASTGRVVAAPGGGHLCELRLSRNLIISLVSMFAVLRRYGSRTWRVCLFFAVRRRLDSCRWSVDGRRRRGAVAARSFG